MKGRADPRGRQRGAAAVEFALVFTLLLMLVVGVIDWGWYFFIDQLVTNSAREGARAGTLLPPLPANAGAATGAAHDAAIAFLKAANLNPPDQYVVASYTTIGTTDAIQVVVTYPVGSLTGLLSNLMPANTHATAVMRWQ